MKLRIWSRQSMAVTSAICLIYCGISTAAIIPVDTWDRTNFGVNQGNSGGTDHVFLGDNSADTTINADWKVFVRWNLPAGDLVQALDLTIPGWTFLTTGTTPGTGFDDLSPNLTVTRVTNNVLGAGATLSGTDTNMFMPGLTDESQFGNVSTASTNLDLVALGWMLTPGTPLTVVVSAAPLQATGGNDFDLGGRIGAPPSVFFALDGTIVTIAEPASSGLLLFGVGIGLIRRFRRR